MSFILFGNRKWKRLLLAFILGLALALIFNYLLALLGLLIVLVFCLFKPGLGKGAIILAYLLGVFRVFLLPPPLVFPPGKYELSAKVCAEPDVRLDQQKLVLCSKAGKILATVGLYPPYHYGESISFLGQIETPGEIDGFKYDRYLAKQGIYLVSRQPKLQKDSEAKISFWSGIFLVKEKLKQIIDRAMKEPEAGLGNALILGYKNTVAREYLDLFSLIGVSHMIAISGTHITIMAVIWQKVMGVFSNKPKLFLTAIFLSLYILLTGSSAAALRSLVMGLMSLMIIGKKGKQDGEWLLLFSAALMLAINPLLLTADLGFQLSYLAMIALIYFYPAFKSWFSGVKGNRVVLGMLDVLLLTLASQLLTAPLIAVNFVRFSMIAPLANILLLWIFPFLMGALLSGLAASVIIPFLAKLFFLPAYFGLWYIFWATKTIARIPLASLNWELGWGGFLFCYGLIFLLYYFILRPQKNRA